MPSVPKTLANFAETKHMVACVAKENYPWEAGADLYMLPAEGL
jgi:hypothetical protein